MHKNKWKGKPTLGDDDIRILYSDSKWQNRYYNFHPSPSEFSGPPQGLKKNYDRVPTMLQFFGIFWDRDTLHRICAEINRYAMEELKVKKYGEADDGHNEFYTRGGVDWFPIDEKELKAFIVVSLYMGLKNFQM